MATVTSLTSRTKLQVERARARFGWFDVVVRVFKRFSEDDGGTGAAALTYYMFFSIFPMLLFAASALGYATFLSEDFRRQLFRAGFEAFPLLGSIVDPRALKTLQEQRGTLAIVGLVLALYAGSGGVVALKRALNKISRVRDEGSFVAKRIASLKWLAWIGTAAFLSVVLGAASAYVGDITGVDSNITEVALYLTGHVLSFALGLFIFWTAFKLLPRGVRSWKDVFPGALLATVGFTILKMVGPWYLQRGAESRSATFGAFASAAGLLIACYLLAQVTLLSAEVNAVLAERRETRRTSP